VEEEEEEATSPQASYWADGMVPSSMIVCLCCYCCCAGVEGEEARPSQTASSCLAADRAAALSGWNFSWSPSDGQNCTSGRSSTEMEAAGAVASMTPWILLLEEWHFVAAFGLVS
jgi:hypothetical protein